MLVGRSRWVPSARDLTLAVLAVACVIQASGWLPARGWLGGGMAALASSALLALLARTAGARLRSADRGGKRRATWLLWASSRLPFLVRVVGAVLVGSLAVLGQVHRGLDARLPPALEGQPLEIVGVVDGMPQRFGFGDRVGFAVSSCRAVVHAPGSALEPAPDAEVAPGCGGLARVQLDWGPPRERDRGIPSDAALPGRWENDAVGSDAAEADADRPQAGVARRPRDGVWAHPGTWWRLRVRLKRPVAPVNPGTFDLELRLLQQGIGAVGRVDARERLPGPPGRPGWSAVSSFLGSPGAAVLVAFEGWRTRLRDGLEAVHAQRVDPAASGGAGRWQLVGIVTGLSLGDQGAIGASLWTLFSRTGVSHLMAISGMHVTMLALVAGWLAGHLLRALARCSGLPRLPAGLPRQSVVLGVTLVVAFGYALLSGWGVPAQRTCWMLLAAALLNATGRGGVVFEPVLLAAGIVVAIDPWAVGSAGFWLSFGAVVAIMLCAHGRQGGVIRAAATSQWAATVALAPPAIALFSTLSLIGPLANAMAIPWVSFVVTPLAVAAALLAPIAPSLCAWLLRADLQAIDWMIALLELLDRLPAASAAIARPDGWTLAAAMIGAALLVAPPGVPLRAAGVPCLLPLLLAPQRLPGADSLWITALDMGQGSSILVETAQTRLLYDAGPARGDDRSAAGRFLVPYLRSRGIERIDALVVSHLDAEHAGGAAAVAALLRPKLLLTSFDPRLLSLPESSRRGMATERCEAGRRLAVGDLQLDLLHPPQTARLRQEARGNDASCVLRIRSPAGSLLLAGDLPASADAALVASAGDRLRSTLLALPQQGGRNAASRTLLEAVAPSYALLQVAYRNRHRHPHPEVLGRLARSGVSVLRTDQDGAVQVRLRPGRSPQVFRARGDAPPYWRVPVRASPE